MPTETSPGSAAIRSSTRRSSRSERAVDRVRKLVGAPYKHTGRGRGGIDCFGLVLHAYELDEAAGGLQDVVRATGGSYYHDRRWHKNKEAAAKSREALFRYISNHFVKVLQIKPGDLIALSYKSRGEADHLGVYVGDGAMVHSDMREGVTEIPLDEVWDRIVGVYRVKD